MRAAQASKDPRPVQERNTLCRLVLWAARQSAPDDLLSASLEAACRE